MKDQNLSNDIKTSFKTNINCSGCVARVTVELNKLSGLTHWSVNTLSPDKILTVTTADANIDNIIKAVQQAGFNIEPIK